jgi:hypothetical protein
MLKSQPPPRPVSVRANRLHGLQYDFGGPVASDMK